jgi:hypothetical protein
MNKLNTAKRVQILSALVEGNSLRSTDRMCGASINTVTKLLVDAGTACSRFQDQMMYGLDCKRIQCDEIWCFCHSKQKNVAPERQGILGFGDVWTWAAIDADTKLVPTWFIGHRDVDHAIALLCDLSKRLTGRIQLTTDGLAAYREAVAMAFPKVDSIDYAMLIKTYATEAIGPGRYSPPVCNGAKPRVVRGNPDPDEISTS